MTFQRAIEHVLTGRRMRRAIWLEGLGLCISDGWLCFYYESDIDPVDDDGNRFQLDTDDLRADDWQPV